jgi:Predicted integral membrane protein (DUF2269)
MAEFYPWFVLLHLIGLVIFAVCHGASIFMAYQVRGQRDPATVAAILGVGGRSIGPMYVGLVLLAVGGLGAAVGGNLLTQPWVIASIITFVVVLVVMWAVASPYYMNLRTSLAAVDADGRPTIDEDTLATQLASRRLDALLAVGGVGLAILIWLMVIKPG